MYSRYLLTGAKSAVFIIVLNIIGLAWFNITLFTQTAEWENIITKYNAEFPNNMVNCTLDNCTSLTNDNHITYWWPLKPRIPSIHNYENYSNVTKTIQILTNINEDYYFVIKGLVWIKYNIFGTFFYLQIANFIIPFIIVYGASILVTWL